MAGIIKKDLRYILIYQLPLLLGMSLMWLIIKRELDATFIIVMGGFIFVMIVGAVFTNEANEEKNKGYAFLYPMPISTFDIVGAKFALILLVDISLTIYTLVLFSFFKAPDIVFELSRIYMMSIGIFALVIAACLYIGIFRFGFATFMRALTIFSMFLTIIPIAFKELMQPSGIFDPVKTYKFVTSVNWYLVAVAALAVYYLLMLLAVKIKDRYWMANI